MDVREVIQALHYEEFLIDWHDTYSELNKPGD